MHGHYRSRFIERQRDSIAFGLEAGNSGQQAQSDPHNLARDKGVCDFDVRHNFVANTVYRLPFSGSRWVDGWQLSGILTARSGTPFSIQDGIDQANLNDLAMSCSRLLSHCCRKTNS
jgi:hypothetical protein